MHACLKIKDVSRHTGLTADVIRVWERRYGALSPQRDANEHRVYGADDVRRLLLLRDAVARGHAISQIAGLDDSSLLALSEPGSLPDVNELLARMLMTIRAHEAGALHELLTAALQRFGIVDFCDLVATPLLHEVGAYWLRDASLIAKEHLATAAVNAVLDAAISRCAVTGGRLLLFATIARERHDTGAKMAAAVAAENGLRTIVLAPGSAPDEVADVARRLGAHGVGVSVVYQSAEHTLRDLYGRLHIPLWVGGSRAPAGPWVVVSSMREFARALNEI